MMKTFKIIIGLAIFSCLINCQSNLHSSNSLLDGWIQSTLSFLQDECDQYPLFVESLKVPNIPQSHHGSNDLNEVIKKMLSVRQDYYPRLMEQLKMHELSLEGAELFEHFTSNQLRVRAHLSSGKVFSTTISIKSKNEEFGFSLRSTGEYGNKFIVDEGRCIAIERGIFPNRFVFVSTSSEGIWHTIYAKIY